jgi:hypothetical protein
MAKISFPEWIIIRFNTELKQVFFLTKMLLILINFT